MAHTRTWNAALEAIPPNTQAASQGADRIRDFKLDFRERFELDHVMDETDDDGYHVQVTLEEQASAPGNLADKLRLYALDVGGVTELYSIDSAGNAFQVTDAGKLFALGTNNTWTKGQAALELNITYAASMTLDAATSNAFRILLTGNVTFEPPDNGILGQVLTVAFQQDGTGSRILTFGTTLYGNTGDDLVLSTGANKRDVMTLLHSGSANRWYVLSLKKDIDNAL